MIERSKPAVIIDCLGVIIGTQRGAERFTCELLKEVSDRFGADYLLLVNRISAPWFIEHFGKSRCFVAPISGNRRWIRLLFQMLISPLLAAKFRANIYVSTAVFPPIGFPCPVVAVLHDLMVFHHPESFSRITSLIRVALVRASVPQLDGLITISQFSATDIQQVFRGCAPAVRIVPCGVRPNLGCTPDADTAQRILAELKLRSGCFVLSVLGGKPYKNQKGLAHAAAELVRLGNGDLDVVVVGDAIRVFSGLPTSPNLRVLGNVSDQTLAVLYQAASASVVPSLFEGFGIGVIEAQLFGLPVACSDIPVLREVSGNAAYFFDPHDPRSIAQAIVKLQTDAALRAHLIELGRTNAQRYTWGHAAESFIDAVLWFRAQPKYKPHLGARVSE
jgi:glycosyltransferase involved in cell wall biosynthesis